MVVLYGIIGLAVFSFILVKLYFAAVGLEKLVVYPEQRTPFEVEEQTEESILLSTKIPFVNEGKQCATIMDAFVRPLLPYEQYDGIDARGKAECEGCPREDDYFEAVLVYKKGDKLDRLNILMKVRLTARKGMKLKEALEHMVDLPLELIWMEVGRMPWRYRKIRVVLPVSEIAALAGVVPAKY